MGSPVGKMCMAMFLCYFSVFYTDAAFLAFLFQLVFFGKWTTKRGINHKKNPSQIDNDIVVGTIQCS